MKTFQLTSILLTGLALCFLANGQAVTPQEQDGKYYFQVANVYFEVDPSYGARITSFQIDSEEILWGSAYPGDYLWGSTLWQSPQSEWNWPPSVMLDQDPYSGGIAGDSIALRSDVDITYSHLVFRKVFTASLSDTSVSIAYTMINKGSSANSFSAWEVTRVPAGGISFFPKGEGNVTGALAGQTELINDVVWYEQEDSDPAGQKFFCDGAEGWSAHVNDDRQLFVKKFENAPATGNAPGENEIELYYSGPTSNIELENQSAYGSIAVDDSVRWMMKWYLRNLPADIETQTGNSTLVNYARSIVAIRQPDAIENALTSTIELYPNPADKFLKLSFEGLSFAHPVRYRINDMAGGPVAEGQLNTDDHGTINIEELTPGMYIIGVQSGDMSMTGKFIKSAQY